MSSGRLVTSNGRNVFIKDRIRRGNDKFQIWYFDGKTKTIKSQQYKNKSLDLEHAGRRGRGTNLHIWSTNSGWW